MPTIRTRINYRNYTLSTPEPGDTIGVITRDGNYQHCRWRGFIERYEAMAMPDAIPVKLFANAYKMDDGVMGSWVDIGNAHALQGCWQAGNEQRDTGAVSSRISLALHSLSAVAGVSLTTVPCWFFEVGAVVCYCHLVDTIPTTYGH